MNNPTTTFSAGLEGVIACATRLSHVDGTAGKLIFSGHNAVKLAETKTVEEVWFLLHEGRLPSADELNAFRIKVEVWANFRAPKSRWSSMRAATSRFPPSAPPSRPSLATAASSPG